MPRQIGLFFIPTAKELYMRILLPSKGRGNVVKMNTMVDYASPQLITAEPHLSIIRQTEYDCKELKLKTVAMIAYSEHMSKGKVIYSNTVIHGWELVDLGTLSEDETSIACGENINKI